MRKLFVILIVIGLVGLLTFPTLAQENGEEPLLEFDEEANEIYAFRVSNIIGSKVRNPEGDDLGKIEEIVIDVQEGKIVYAVLSFGGVLGISDKYFAIPWESLAPLPIEGEFVLNVSKSKLETAPGFDKSKWPNMKDREWGSGIYGYYGLTPYWVGTRGYGRYQGYTTETG
ncbi:MAG TPA: hypothetical protein DCY12_04685 [Candidatus Atribacteria bacterium]|nr:hypothetical protein [Candidatus Atribacteria bacterium]HCU22384.1 hypothetical protein [Candidatus Atribacteria bacterium]